MVAINEYDMVAGHRLDEPAATLGDFTIEFPAGVMRCQLCPVGPGQSRPRAVCSSVETYTLLQFVLAAREHVSEAHTGHRWAP